MHFAFGHLGRSKDDGRRVAGIGHFLTIEVVAVLDRPVDLERIARIGHRISIGGLCSEDILFTQGKDGNSGQKQEKAA